MDGIIALQEAKKVKKLIGKLPELLTDHKENAVVAINELKSTLSLLLPNSPALLSSKTISFIGTSCLLSRSVPDNTTSHIPSAGSTIKSTRSKRPETSVITSFGSGKSGSLSVKLNGLQSGSKTLSAGNDSGTYGDLVITRNQDFPLATPGFWEDLDAKFLASSDLQAGYNEAQMLHSETGSTNLTGIIIDNGIGNPGISNFSLSQISIVTSYSSGVAHYGTNSVLRIQARLSNIITNVYASVLAQINANGGFGGVSLNASILGIGIPANGDLIDLLYDLTLTTQFFSKLVFTVLGYHPLASTASFSSTQNVLAKINTSGIEGISAGRRVYTGNWDETTYDAVSPENPTVALYNSATIPQAHEAKIVAGILAHDVTNYMSGYMPAQPNGADFSSHAANQYCTLVFALNASSSATISVAGNYEKCWIKLPGITGWLDTMANYGGAGTPSANGASCRTTGGVSKNTFAVTFGGNNTSVCGNTVLLRFKMKATHAISSITIS